MDLNIFVYVLLIFCIPYLLYSNIRIRPRKGFSVLFISIISTVILLNFSLITIVGTIFLILTLLIKSENFHPYLYGVSFSLLSYEIFTVLNLNIFEFVIDYLFPISLVSGVFSSMMIGHWFLVDPTISKEGMKKIAITSTIQSLSLIHI